MEEIKALNKLPNDWDLELKKNGLYPDLSEAINKLLLFHKEGKEIFPAFNNIYKAFELCSYSNTKIGRAHVRTPVTEKSRMPSSA